MSDASKGTNTTSNAIKLFYSYAPADENLCQELEDHLALLQRQCHIAGWQRRSISPGSNWQEEITAQLDAAQLILLLVSASFIASDFCYSTEMTRALARHNHGAHIIPILLRSCHWQSAPFGHLSPLPANGIAVTEWPSRDRAFLAIAEGVRQVVEKLKPILTDTSGGSAQRIFHVPFARNLLFTGREDVLTHLHETLSSGQTAALTQHVQHARHAPQAISGLGGIGKTQTALEYAYRYAHEYQYVFWVKAETREELVPDLASIATALNLQEKNVQNQNEIVAAVQRWLAAHTDWLLIFDNADDLHMVANYCPSGNTGHILLTTRAQAMGRLAHKVEIEKMEPEEGALFLLRRASLIGQEQTLAHASANNVAKAREIVQALDGLPLALDQAAAYIEETECSLSRYLELYGKQHAKLLKRRGSTTPIHDHPKPVATTWELSFQKVEHANPAAADLLRLCAFLAPDAIPEEIITKGADQLGPTLQAVAKDPFELDAAIEELRKYSLVKRNREIETLTVHRLVQAVLIDEMDEETQRQWAEHAVRAVNNAFPSGDYGIWPQCERLLLHAQACATLITQWNMAFEEAARLLNNAARYLWKRGQYLQAELLLQQLLTIREKVLEPEHPDVAQSLNNLALLYMEQGKYEQAKRLYQRALAIREKVLGPEHPDVAPSLNNLALLYQAQGKYEQAEPLYRRALAILEKVFVAGHPNLATCLENYAGLLRRTNREGEAVKLEERARAMRARYG